MAKYTQAEWDKRIDEAAERAVGLYMEETERRFGLVLESTSSISEQLKNVPTRNEFNELSLDVRTIRLAVTDTNKDLRGINKPGWFPGKRH